jgi:hypothetical protein
MVDPSERLAQAVRANSPLAHCFACLAGQLGLTEKAVRDAAQVLIVREPFLLQRRACSLCLKVCDIFATKQGQWTTSLSPQQRAHVLASITSGRLRLDPPKKMYAGYGDGRECTGCGEVIDTKQVEHEAIYENGQAYRLHLACAAVWDVERRRRQHEESLIEDARRTRA